MDIFGIRRRRIAREAYEAALRQELAARDLQKQRVERAALAAEARRAEQYRRDEALEQSRLREEATAMWPASEPLLPVNDQIQAVCRTEWLVDAVIAREKLRRLIGGRLEPRERLLAVAYCKAQPRENGFKAAPEFLLAVTNQGLAFRNGADTGFPRWHELSSSDLSYNTRDQDWLWCRFTSQRHGFVSDSPARTGARLVRLAIIAAEPTPGMFKSW